MGQHPTRPTKKSNQPLAGEDVRVIENRQGKFLTDCCRDCGRHCAATICSGLLDDPDLALMPTLLKQRLVH